MSDESPPGAEASSYENEEGDYDDYDEDEYDEEEDEDYEQMETDDEDFDEDYEEDYGEAFDDHNGELFEEYNGERFTAESPKHVAKVKQEDEKSIQTLVDSYDSYIVVSVLTATASFASLLDDSYDNPEYPLANSVSVLLCTICSLSGMYATVVFSFSSIYGRTAIGIGRVETYEAFLKKTAHLRLRAFHSYLVSLVIFILLLVIAAAEKIDKSLAVPFVGLLMFCVANVYRDLNQIIVSAGVIFAPPKNNEAPTNKKKLTLFQVKEQLLEDQKPKDAQEILLLPRRRRSTITSKRSRFH